MMFKKSSLLLLSMLGVSTPLLANPNGPQVINGAVTFNGLGSSQLDITNTSNAIINWQQFNISSNELTRFIQQSNQSAVLNRVIGQNPSQILGQLQSNGKVFVINQNGLIVGQNARIDTAGFVASALNLTDENFLNGNLNFENTDNHAEILNRGFIHTTGNGEVILIAPVIKNEGIIQTEGGQIILAAGQKITLSNLSDPNITFEVQAPHNKVINLGELITKGGSVNIFANSIQQNGSINANQITRNAAGNIVLGAIEKIDVTGDISTQGNVGGNIQITANEIVISDNAKINASGLNGGGEILIGGDQQGLNPDVKNATSTSLLNAASIHADAIEQGDGGRIILFAENDVHVHGNITAKGGINGGDGGFVETSGKQHLDITNTPDANAVNGNAGTWLIDPNNITIQDTGSDTNIDTIPSIETTHTSNADGAILLTSTIESALNTGTNVIVTTGFGGVEDGDIIVNDNINKTAGADADLTLIAHNDIVINADITSTVGILNLILDADTDSANGGQITLNTTTLDANGGSIDASAEIVVLNSGTATIDSAMSVADFFLSGGTLNGTGAVDVSGAFTWDSSSGLSSSGIFTTNGTSTVSTSATHNMTNGNWTNEGTVNWTSGQFQGSSSSITNNGVFNFSSALNPSITSGITNFTNGSGGIINVNTSTTLDSVTFNNHGSVLIDPLSAGSIILDITGDGTHTGTWHTGTSDDTLNFGGGGNTKNLTSGSISGTGNILFSGANTLSSGLSFTANSVTISNGVTTFSSGVTVDTDLITLTSGTLNFNSGSTLGGSTFGADIPIVIAGGHLNLSTGSSHTIPSLTLTFGVLEGSDALTVTGPFIWDNDGGLNSSGTFTTNGTSTVSTSTTHTMTNTNWINGGTVNWTGGQFQGSSSSITNNGIFNFASTVNPNVSAGVAFTNGSAGTINVNTSTVISSAFTNTDGSNINFNSANLSLNGASLTIGSSSSLNGIGTFTGNVINDGTLRPGTAGTIGTLTITGNYTQGTGGILEIEIDDSVAVAGTNYDLLAISGTADLQGTLKLLDIGVYNVSDADTLVPITYAAASNNTFATINSFNTAPNTTTVTVNSSLQTDILFNVISGAIWDNGSGDNLWSTAINWVGDALPTIGDDIDLVNFNVILTSIESIGQLSLSLGGSLTVSGNGSLTIANNSNLSGDVTINGTNAVINAAGTLNIIGNLNLIEGQLTSVGDITVTGLTSWNSVVNNSFQQAFILDGAGGLIANGGFELGDSLNLDTLTLDKTLTINNVSIWDNGLGSVTSTINGSGSIINNSTITVINTNPLVIDVPFTNSGTGILTKNSGTGELRFFDTLTNNGIINADIDIIRVTSAFTNDGVINTTNGTFDASAISFTNSATGILSGTGTFIAATGGITNNGAVKPGGSGTIGTLTITGNYTQGTGGILEIEIDDSVAVAGTNYDLLAISGTADLQGTLKLLDIGVYNVSDADTLAPITYAAASNNTFAIINSFNTAPNTTTVTVNSLSQTDILFNVISGAIWDNGSGDNLWSTAINWVGDALPTIGDDIDLVNFNVILTSIESIGQLSLSLGGSLTVSGNGSLTIANNSNLSGDVTINGTNAVINAAGTLNIIGNLNLIEGQLTSVGDITVTGLTTWNAPSALASNQAFSLLGAGAFNANGGFALGGNIFNDTLTLDKILTIGAISTWNANNNSGTTAISGTGSITNNSTITVASNAQAISVNVPFTNTGTVTKSSGTGNLIFSNTMTNNGTVNADFNVIQVNTAFTNDGIINTTNGSFDASTVSFTNSAAGILSGSGTFVAPSSGLVNNGIIRPGGSGSTGALSIAGNYTQGTGGILEIEINDSVAVAGTNYDLLAISGTADLQGTLKLLDIGVYNVSDADTLAPITYAAASNTFSTINSFNTAPNTTTVTVNSLSQTDILFNVISDEISGAIWDNGSGDNLWSTATNWVGDILPTSSDNVFLGLTGGIILSDGSITNILALSGTNSLSITGTGTQLTVIGDSIIGNDLTINGSNALLNITGTLEVTGDVNLQQGGLTVSGLTTVTGLTTWNAAFIDVGAQNFALNGAGAFLANGGFDIGGNIQRDTLTLNKALLVNAESSWSLANILAFSTINGSGNIINSATITASNNLNNFFIEVGFDNTASATFTKATGLGDVIFTNESFENAGIFNMNAAVIRLEGNGIYNHSGTFNIANNATLDLRGGAHTFGAFGSVTGTGRIFNVGAITDFSTSGLQAGHELSVSTGSVEIGITSPTLESISVSGGSLTTGSVAITVTDILSVTNTGQAIFSDNVIVNNQTRINGATALLDVSGTLTVLGSLNLLEGSLNTTGDVTVTGLTTWNEQSGIASAQNFSLLGAGALLANGGFDLGSNLRNDTLTLDKALTIGADSAWTSDITVSSSNSILGSGSITNNANLTITNPQVLTIGVEFTNNAIATVTKASGSGDLIFINSMINAGTLNANFDAISMNSVFVNSTGITNINGGSLILSEVGNPIDAGVYNMTSGLLQLNSDRQFNNATFNLSGGTLNVNGSTIAVNGLLTLDNTSLTGNGTINANAGILIFGNTLLDAATLVNAVGQTTTVNANLTLNNSASFINDGSYDLAGDFSLLNTIGNARFNNSGSFIKSAGAGTSQIDVDMTNSGVIDIQSGLVSFNGSYLQNGGSLTLIGDTTFNNLELASGTLTLPGTLTVTSVFNWSGTSTINGGGILQLNPESTMNLKGTGATYTLDNMTVNTAGSVNYTDGLLVLDNSIFNNLVTGVFNLAGDFDVGGVGTSQFNNQGSLIKTTGTGTSIIGNTVAFTNTGTVVTNTGLGALEFLNGFTQDSGLLINNGSMIASNFIINAGVVQGNGTYVGNVDMSGSSGTGTGILGAGNSVGALAINGDLILGPNSTFSVELEGTNSNQYDIVNVSGNTTFDGALAISFENGYLGAINDRFTPITTSTASGQFASLNVETGSNFKTVYNPNNFQLEIIGTPQIIAPDVKVSDILINTLVLEELIRFEAAAEVAEKERKEAEINNASLAFAENIKEGIRANYCR